MQYRWSTFRHRVRSGSLEDLQVAIAIGQSLLTHPGQLWLITTGGQAVDETRYGIRMMPCFGALDAACLRRCQRIGLA